MTRSKSLLRVAIAALLLGATVAPPKPPGWLNLSPAGIAQTPPPSAARFSDIHEHWAEPCIESTAAQGLLQGYPDGRFGPEGTLSRAEFAAIMVKAFPNAPPIRSAPHFSDVPANHWAKGAIAKAYSLGFLSGYPGNLFQPNQPISKAQALTILANSQSLPPVAQADTILQQAYIDAATMPTYARSAIAAATVKGLVVNYPNLRELQPNRALGRGEAAALLCQVNAIRSATGSQVPAGYIVQIILDDNNRPARLTTLLKEFSSQSSGELLSNSQIAADRLFFAASDGETGQELWVTDGTAAGTKLVRDLAPGLSADGVANSSNPRFVGAFGSRVGFLSDQAYDPKTLANGLWSSDGTTQGTVAIASLSPELSQALSNANGLTTEINGKITSRLPFVVTTPTDIQLWQTDGLSTSATRLLKRFERHDFNATPQLFTPLPTPAGENIFFASTSAAGAHELWRSDGSPEGTISLKTNVDPAGEPFTPWQNQIHIQASTPEQGFEWWTSDGTAAGTLLLKDIYPGAESSAPRFLTGLGDRLFALANSPNGFELWVSEGTPATTHRVKQLSTQPSFRAERQFIVYNQKLFFAIPQFQRNSPFDPAYEIWMTDGTEQGTQRLAQFGTGGVSELTVFKGRLFFSGDGPDGQELWVSDGTPQGTQQLMDLSPGTSTIVPPCVPPNATETPVCPPPFVAANSTVLRSLTVRGDWLYFMADGIGLYRTDGTAVGTQRVQSFNHVSGGHPVQLVQLGEQLLFTTYDLARDGDTFQDTLIQLWALP